MITIAPHASSALKKAVHGPCNSDRCPRHAARQRDFVARLDEHVHVVELHGKMSYAKPLACGLGKRANHFSKHNLSPQTRQPSHRAQGDVHRMSLQVKRTPNMRNPA
jgi:hypothetical protein